jgi:hypothetical protein
MMPRTTLELDAAVLRELRRLGRRANKSIGQVASELLADALIGWTSPPDPRFNWKSARLGKPLVDLENKEAVDEVLGEGT